MGHKANFNCISMVKLINSDRQFLFEIQNIFLTYGQIQNLIFRGGAYSWLAHYNIPCMLCE